MPKSTSSASVGRPKARPTGKQGSTRKLVYAAILKEQDRKITQEVQAALRSAGAGELLFRKA